MIRSQRIVSRACRVRQLISREVQERLIMQTRLRNDAVKGYIISFDECFAGPAVFFRFASRDIRTLFAGCFCQVSLGGLKWIIAKLHLFGLPRYYVRQRVFKVNNISSSAGETATIEIYDLFPLHEVEMIYMRRCQSSCRSVFPKPFPFSSFN